MTGHIVILQPAAVHVISDGLAAGQGRQTGCAKAFPLPHLNAIVGIRGHVPHFNVISLIAATATTFDGAADNLESIARGFAEDAARFMPACPDADFDVILAGFSETRGIEANYVGGRPPTGEPYERWRLSGPVTALPGERGAQEAVESIVADPNTFDVHNRGHAAMNAIRRRYPEIVGNFTQSTSLIVDQDGPYIISEIVGRWPELSRRPQAMADHDGH